MSEKKKVLIVNLITGSRIIGTFLLPVITSIFGPLGTALYIGSLWATDAIDGYLAKHKWEVSTIFGANLDAFSDKIFGIAAFLYLRTFYPAMIIPVLLETAIFATNFAYGRKGSDVKSSYLGKFKTGVFAFFTGLSVLSTISLTSGLSTMIPALISIASIVDAATLGNYIYKNEKYLRTHTPKNDVSHMGFFETIKTIIKKLGDKNIYSPEYYKQHKNETLLDMLSEKEAQEKNGEGKNEQEINLDTDYFSVQEKNSLKLIFNINDKEIDKVENYAIKHNIEKEQLCNYLTNYINDNDYNSKNIKDITHFIAKEKEKGLKKLDK